jgi:hypothetical protein
MSDDHVKLIVEPAETPIEENNPAAAMYEQLVRGEFQQALTTAAKLRDVLSTFQDEEKIFVGISPEKDGAAMIRIEAQSSTVLLAGMKVI